MLSEGATNENLKELSDLLNLTPDHNLRFPALQSLHEKLNTEVDGIGYDKDFKEEKQIYLKTSVANSAWISNDFQVIERYRTVLKEYYSAELETVNMRDPGVPTRVNNWIKDKTNGLIDKVINDIPSSTVMILVNTIYFKAKWAMPFESSRTSKRMFTKRDHSQVERDFMAHRGYFINHIPVGDDTYVFELGYKGYKHCMIFKYGKNGLQHIKEDEINKLIHENNRTNTRADLYIPKFDIETSYDMKEMLERLDVHNIFKLSTTGFSGISKDTGLGVSGIIHKSKIKVNEDGTEAAAVTAIFLAGSAYIPTKPKLVVLDHPFSYYVYHIKERLVLFSGVLG